MLLRRTGRFRILVNTTTTYRRIGMHSRGSPRMMTFPVPMSLSSAKALSELGSSSCTLLGHDAAGCPLNRNDGMRPVGGRQVPVKPNIHLPRRQCTGIRSWGKSRDVKSLGSYTIEGSPYSVKDDRVEAVPEKDINGKHFLFDNKYEILEKTLISPLPRDYRMPRSGNLLHFSFPKELSHSPVVRPFTLGSYEEYDLNASPAILFPSALVLNGRSAFSMDSYKFNRPKVNYRACSLFTLGDNHKSQSYLDPMAGASHLFIQRISELSSLEGETIRQEKLKKMRRTRKNDS